MQMGSSRVIGAKFTPAQINVLEQLQMKIGCQRMSDVVRIALKAYVEEYELDWPEHTFVQNEEREGKPIPWIDYESMKRS
jgi:hypothetical protein